MLTGRLTEVPRLEWDEFLEEFQWYQGEHLTCIGPTKSGKTTLIRELLRRARRERTHPWQVVIATKRKDEILDTFKTEGFMKIPEWHVSDPELTPRIMLAPPLPNARDKHVQADQIREALTGIYRQGGWLVTLDELKHIAAYLKLEPEVELLWHQGRSAGISVVSGIQRPRHVPLMAYDQSEHLFMWESRDHNIRKRLAEIGGRVDPDLVMAGITSLPTRHDFLYVNTATGRVAQTKVRM